MSRSIYALLLVLTLTCPALLHADDLGDADGAAPPAARRQQPAADAAPDPQPHHHHHGAGGDDSPGRPDAHAPIGVMGEHMHPAGGFMLSYRYMFMNMDGSRDGDSRVGDGEVLRRYPVTPTAMDTQMHMFGAMYAPIDQVTLMAMLPLVQKDMDHITRAGGKFDVSTFGVGDFKLSAMVRLWENETHHFHLNAGMSFPTGSTTEKDDTPMGNVRLPYPMQLGSGTYDILPGVTYTGQTDAWSWGAQASGVIRTGRNDEGYRWGHGYELSAWGAKPWTEWVSTSLRLKWKDVGNISGSDSRFNPRLVPTADPDLRAFGRLDVGVGLNFLIPGGPLKGNRFAVEGLFPVYQHVDGPQLEQDWMVTAGWQYAF